MGVGKVVQELHGMLKLVFVIMVATIYVCCWAIGEVISVIEMVVDEKDEREVHKVGMVVTKEWRKAKSAKLEFAFVSAFRDNSSFGLNILGPLCLWQCFYDV